MFQANSAAAALDAADGVMDGRFFGRGIVQAQQPVQSFSTFGTTPVIRSAGVTSFGGVGSSAAALDAADGVIDGKFYGRPIVQQATPAFTSFGGVATTPMIGSSIGTFGTPSVGSSALALDAADGRIDGQFFGRPIVQASTPAFTTPAFTSGVVSTTPSFTTGVSSAALSLDAADGVIDGKCFGRPIVQAQPQIISQPSFISAAPQVIQQPMVMQSQVIQQPQFLTTAPAMVGSSALALDAADGKIDGKFFGRQIVQQQPQFVAGAAPMGSSALALDAADGKIDGKFFGRQIVQAQPQIVGAAPTSSAMALDAADGRIDGKFFGRPIVQAGGPQVVRSTTPAGNAAAALDAADGVIDGRFFGRPIVQQGRPAAVARR